MFKSIKKFFGLSPASETLANDYRKEGNQYLAAGNLDAAAQCYRQAIDADPNQAEGYVNLGFVLSEQQQYDAAIPHLKKALTINPKEVDAIYLLGSIAQQQKNTSSAKKYFNQVINIKPSLEIVYPFLYSLLMDDGDDSDAEEILIFGIKHNPTSAELNYLLGDHYLAINNFEKSKEYFNKSLSLVPNQASIYCKLGDIAQKEKAFDQAINFYRQALAIQPEFIEVYNNLGVVFSADNKTDDAIECFKKAISLTPDNAKLYFNLGNMFKNKKLYNEAITNYKKSIELDKNYCDVFVNLGMAFQESNQFDKALENYNKALELNPNCAEAEYCLGYLYSELGKYGDAIERYQKAILLKNNYSDALNNLGKIFQSQGNIDLAFKQYTAAIHFNEEHYHAHNNLGGLFRETNQLDRAIEHFRKAIMIKPDLGEAYNNLGGALEAQGRHDEAIQCYQQAALLIPDVVLARSNLLFSQSMDEHYIREAKAYGQYVMRQATPYTDWLMSFATRHNQPLRVGLVSGDLLEHPVGYFLETVVQHLDARRVQLLVYSTFPREDELTKALKSHCVSWTDISYLSDEAAAKQIRDDQVDILIDLAGHTGHNRVALFGWKPAPVQVTWLGYWASTGVPTIDYVLADEESLPFSLQNQFTEKAWYLPNTRMCFSAPSTGVAVSALPAKTNGYITFGSFQKMGKIGDDVLALWSRVLNELPSARLRLQSRQLNDESIKALLKTRLEKAGITLERVAMIKGVPRQAYLEAHSEVDIILDTVPFSGGTTTCEALWMGVPTVTLAGNTMIARQGASMLTCVGLKDWVANTKEEYINIAINKASDVSALAQLRTNLRDQVQTSPLFDAVTFARNLEKALHQMWDAKIRSVNVYE